MDRSFHLGLSTNAAIAPGIYFLIQDNKSYEETKRPKTIKQTKQFRFLTTKLNLSLSEECDCHPAGSASGEFALAIMKQECSWAINLSYHLKVYTKY